MPLAQYIDAFHGLSSSDKLLLYHDALGKTSGQFQQN